MVIPQYIYKKVPEVTKLFWLIKLLTTAMGEALADYLVFHFNPYISVIAGFIFFLLSLLLQFSVKKYIPAIYWITAAMVATFGTMAADVVHVVLHIPYIVSALIFLVILISNFVLWYRIEKSLSIHTITTFRKEIFYWIAVVATFALGTATGDLTAIIFGLGYFLSGILFSFLILIPLILYLKFHLREVWAFWIAYILTRPLGASFADWIGKEKSAGGLGIGTGILSLILILLIFLCVLYITYSASERKEELGN